MDRIAQLLDLHENDSSDPFTRFALGFEYYKRGELRSALEWYESILESAPSYTGVYYHLGKLYIELGRAKDAELIYKDGIQVCNRLHEEKDRVELQQALMELDDS